VISCANPSNGVRVEKKEKKKIKKHERTKEENKYQKLT
jgi:hypothetical protein